MTDQPRPADWAMLRMMEELGIAPNRLPALRLDPIYWGNEIRFARYIEKYEQPPVDPDRLDMRRIFAASYSENPMQIEAYLGGLFDDSSHFKHALAEYKKIKGEWAAALRALAQEANHADL